MNTDNKYPVLLALSKIYFVLAPILGTVCFIAFIVLLASNNAGSALYSLIAGIFVVISCLAFSEFIKLFIDIEHNTRSYASFSQQTPDIKTAPEIRQLDDKTIIVGENKYIPLINKKGEAFCLGCRKIDQMDRLFYHSASDAYYHKECIPPN